MKFIRMFHQCSVLSAPTNRFNEFQRYGRVGYEQNSIGDSPTNSEYSYFVGNFYHSHKLWISALITDRLTVNNGLTITI